MKSYGALAVAIAKGISPVTSKFASMSVEELWKIYEEISKLFEARMRDEKKMLKRRLSSLLPANIVLKASRPYPPVVPKFANPDEPSQVWSGRGKRPRWVTEKLASGLALEDLSIGRRSSVAMRKERRNGLRVGGTPGDRLKTVSSE